MYPVVHDRMKRACVLLRRFRLGVLKVEQFSGSSILEMLQEVVGGEPRFKVERIGYPDCFIPHGSIARIHEEYGLTARQVAETLRKAAGHKLQVVVSRDS